MPQVDVDVALDELGRELVNAKFTDDSWELNIRARVSEFLTLREIRTTDWNSRRVTKVGTSAGASVFWSSDGDTATIMVGYDDETWDLAISVPLDLIDDLVHQLENL